MKKQLALQAFGGELLLLSCDLWTYVSSRSSQARILFWGVQAAVECHHDVYQQP